ncbi:MAG TPA: AEC family transporter [bacterium]|nr:AEC family transporter [bacterium]
MQNFLLISESVAPVFLIAFLGIFLKRIRFIDDRFVHASSHLVFSVSLPGLVFSRLSNVDFFTIFYPKQIIFIVVSILLTVAAIWSMAARKIHRGQDLGTYVQGAFRSNYAIVGLAVNVHVFGEASLGVTAVILAFIMPLYNLLSVGVLTMTTRKENRIDWLDTTMRILKNPLIIAVLVSLPFSIFRIPVHAVVEKTTASLAAMTLPLALIGIGGSLNLEAVKRASRLAVSASVVKVILIPAVWTPVAVWLGFRNIELGTLFVLFASPTAISSFIMAKTMEGNAQLAGNIVLISTLAAGVTITAGLFILKSYGFIGLG